MTNTDPLASSSVIEIVISQEQVGIRLDKVLSQLPEFTSRSRVAQLFSEGRVCRGNKLLKASYIPQLHEIIRIHLPFQVMEAEEIKPYQFPLDILFEDEDLLVVNKPAGLVVHPSHGHWDDTLVNVLTYHCKNLAMGFGEKRPGIVHRLDKDTSGLLVVAKNDHSHGFLAKQFREKTIHRLYWALIFGSLSPSKGTLKSFLQRHPQDRKKFASAKESSDKKSLTRGKWAVTHYQLLSDSFVLPTLSPFSLISCRLETGRTHQIRVHLSEFGHPIVGDHLYGGTSRAKNLKSQPLKKMVQKMNRIALHAKELGFVHPRSKKWMDFTSDWPEDLKSLTQLSGFAIV